jgi:ribosomal protein S27AE
MSGRRMTKDEREAEFWSKVDMVDGCWLWKGNMNSAMARMGNGKSARHFAWTIVNGRDHHGQLIPQCDRRCVRPDKAHVIPARGAEFANNQGMEATPVVFTPVQRIRQHQKPCPRCIGGQMLSTWGDQTCMSCGYEDIPEPIDDSIWNKRGPTIHGLRLG